MTKKIFYTLFFFAFLFWNRPIFAHKGSVPLAGGALDAMVCDAPAPDSFRVTSIASDLISLEWTPVWNGATHSLFIFHQDSTGEWANSGNYSSVQGETYSIYGLKSGSYKILIATICPSGETSFKTAEVRFKIIELTTAGRVPKSPVATDCAQINYQNHLWVGFRVKEIETGASNLFDVQIINYNAYVRRLYENSIVAVDNSGVFPVGNEKLQALPSFKIIDLSKPIGLQDIGYVLLTQNLSGPFPTIRLCIDDNAPILWKPGYEFTALTAESVVNTVPPGGIISGLKKPVSNEMFTAQSPFSSSLTVFASDTVLTDEIVSLQLFDHVGRLVQNEKVEIQSGTSSLNTEFLTPGIYFLKINTINDSQTIKVLKSL